MVIFANPHHSFIIRCDISCPSFSYGIYGQSLTKISGLTNVWLTKPYSKAPCNIFWCRQNCEKSLNLYFYHIFSVNMCMKLYEVSPVGSRPSPMELHHMAKSTHSIQSGVTFEPIMQSLILLDLYSFLSFADPSKPGAALKHS